MTAVEWLVEQMLVCNYITKKQYDNCKSWLLQEAKEMEKQQTIEFAEWCLSELLDGSEPKAETMQGLLEIFKNK